MSSLQQHFKSGSWNNYKHLFFSALILISIHNHISLLSTLELLSEISMLWVKLLALIQETLHLLHKVSSKLTFLNKIKRKDAFLPSSLTQHTSGCVLTHRFWVDITQSFRTEGMLLCVTQHIVDQKLITTQNKITVLFP